MFKVRTTLVVVGGSVNLGADVNLYRNAADELKTDDALSVGGSVTFGGTPCVLPYGTTSPTFAINGDVRIYHKAAVPRLIFRSGGTT